MVVGSVVGEKTDLPIGHGLITLHKSLVGTCIVANGQWHEQSQRGPSIGCCVSKKRC